MSKDSGKWWDAEEEALFGVADPNGKTFMERSGLVKLVPVKDWSYDRWQVRFWDKEPENHEGGNDARMILEKHCVETDTHIENLISEFWPSDGRIQWYTYERVAENVGPPPVIGRTAFGDGCIRYRGWEKSQ